MKVKCNNCGKERSLSKPNTEKLIEKFGSEEKAQKGYLCRTCNKEARAKEKESEKKAGNKKEESK